MEVFQERLSAASPMDQRNANSSESNRPRLGAAIHGMRSLTTNSGLMDHLGIREFFTMGYCIVIALPGSCCSGHLTASSPPCSAKALVICLKTQPSHMPGIARENWVTGFMKRRPEAIDRHDREHICTICIRFSLIFVQRVARLYWGLANT